jgi:hypothetical protein
MLHVKNSLPIIVLLMLTSFVENGKTIRFDEI